MDIVGLLISIVVAVIIVAPIFGSLEEPLLANRKQSSPMPFG